MKIRKVSVSALSLITVTLCLVLLASSCAPYRPARIGRGDPAEKETFSLKGIGSEFGRGLTNVAFCWLEIPHEIERRVRENYVGNPFSIITSTVDVAVGTLDGAIWGVERATGGVIELLLCPFPPYGPLMDPAYPPYLNFAQSSEEEEAPGETAEGGMSCAPEPSP